MLEDVSFLCLAVFAKFLGSLSTMVKDLTIGKCTVKLLSDSDDSAMHWNFTDKRIQLESLSVASDALLEFLLRDESPVDFSHLKEAKTRNAEIHLLNKLSCLSPQLVIAVVTALDLESNKEPLKLPIVRKLDLSLLTMERGTMSLANLFQLANPNLEVLNLTIPFDFVTSKTSGLEALALALALSRQPKLKIVNVVVWALRNNWKFQNEPGIEQRWSALLGVLENNGVKLTMDTVHRRLVV
ncbi:uncharacterized protein BT62DRAFT_921677 [Guyanagaster necrorhizus]|uniref:Uncharacterized protein n=1 Tax=Guyanagaster necrorhizus TaxID=856835 RepID=A0A9P8AQ77_9AGAR|nr:uncharacterized protein BT62DRAFT_921677 [Guyanagaster necrorhizus MCA 3950]KAG7443720.1 hypothetical protein BT62DRAFT_921677 [Guyanagaster necrorhizus MCA 3950]